MALKQDYIMKMIEDITRVVCQLILGKALPEYELPKEEAYTATDLLYERIRQLADQGNINEAENILLDEIDHNDVVQFEMGLSFYMHINEFEDEYLEAHQYSRAEIGEGIESLAKLFGVSGLSVLESPVLQDTV